MRLILPIVTVCLFGFGCADRRANPMYVVVSYFHFENSEPAGVDEEYSLWSYGLFGKHERFMTVQGKATDMIGFRKPGDGNTREVVAFCGEQEMTLPISTLGMYRWYRPETEDERNLRVFRSFFGW